ncbi:MAG: hypothetical protein MUO24_10145 [Desulfobacterales bacterium]|nr:hypothetical protein [Desulfobacterales bacterium]
MPSGSKKGSLCNFPMTALASGKHEKATDLLFHALASREQVWGKPLDQLLKAMSQGEQHRRAVVVGRGLFYSNEIQVMEPAAK